jgi:chaperonin GroES
MKIRPLSDRILVKRIAEESRTTGGIYIPDTAKEKPLEAVVVAIGNGKVMDNGELRSPTVKVGDQILIGKYLGSEVKLAGEDHVILREGDILAILERIEGSP